MDLDERLNSFDQMSFEKFSDSANETLLKLRITIIIIVIIGAIVIIGVIGYC